MTAIAIHPPQPIRHQSPHRAGRNFPVIRLKNLVLHLIHDPLQFALSHRPLKAGPLKPHVNFLLIPWHPPSVFFDDAQPDVLLDFLVSRKSFAALKAFPPASNRLASLASPRIDDLQTLFLGLAKWAVHEPINVPKSPEKSKEPGQPMPFTSIAICASIALQRNPFLNPPPFTTCAANKISPMQTGWRHLHPAHSIQ